ncbi:MAG TPA: hypothetical protein EYQ18_27725, partial [Candidatus Handelsmanbacteria bacterium]|nr:hypothetical protein [Candidatus Handelsmanbacteria bacterium]HIK98810.1 hypothetical protein [Dehalococcoidia bacterium]
MAWIPIPNSDYFSEDGKGVYEKFGTRTYFRLNELDEAEEFDFYRSHDNITAFRYPSKPSDK